MDPSEEALEWPQVAERLGAHAAAMRTAVIGLLERLDRLEQRMLADLEAPVLDPAA
jgi:hypothetical protein